MKSLKPIIIKLISLTIFALFLFATSIVILVVNIDSSKTFIYEDLDKASYIDDSFYDKPLDEYFSEYIYWDKWNNESNGIPTPDESFIYPTTPSEWIEVMSTYHLSIAASIINNFIDYESILANPTYSSMEEYDKQKGIPFQTSFINMNDDLEIETYNFIQDSIIVANDLIIDNPSEEYKSDDNTFYIDNSIIIINESIVSILDNSTYYKNISIDNSIIYVNKKSNIDINEENLSNFKINNSIITGSISTSNYSFDFETLEITSDTMTNINNSFYDNFYTYLDDFNDSI